MGKIRHPQHVTERAAEMREQGHTYTSIAKTLDISPKTVETMCIAQGALPPAQEITLSNFNRRQQPDVYFRNGRAVRRFTADDDALLLQLEAEGKTIAQIANALGRAHNTVRARLRILARHDAIRDELGSSAIEI